MNQKDNLQAEPRVPSILNTVFSHITKEAFSGLVQSLIRAILVYVIWNFGLSTEFHTPTISYAAALCISMLSIVLIPSATIKMTEGRLRNLEFLMGDIKILISSAMLRDIAKDASYEALAKQKTIEAAEKSRRSKKTSEKTGTSGIDVDKSDETR